MGSTGGARSEKGAVAGERNACDPVGGIVLKSSLQHENLRLDI